MQPLVEVCVKVSFPCSPNGHADRIVFGIGVVEEDDMRSNYQEEMAAYCGGLKKFLAVIGNPLPPIGFEFPKDKPVACPKPLVSSFVMDMKVTQRTTVRVVKVLDAKGNEIPESQWGGTPTWDTDTPELVNLAPSGAAVVVRAIGPTGDANVLCTIGSATGAFDVNLLAGPAVSVQLTADTPVDDTMTRRPQRR